MAGTGGGGSSGQPAHPGERETIETRPQLGRQENGHEGSKMYQQASPNARLHMGPDRPVNYCTGKGGGYDKPTNRESRRTRSLARQGEHYVDNEEKHEFHARGNSDRAAQRIRATPIVSDTHGRNAH